MANNTTGPLDLVMVPKYNVSFSDISKYDGEPAYHEAITRERCIRGHENAQLLWEFCLEPYYNRRASVFCFGLWGTNDTCPAQWWFQQADPNLAQKPESFIPWNPVDPMSPRTKIPNDVGVVFYLHEKCSYGPAKDKINYNNSTAYISQKVFADVKKYCYQKVHGSQSMPWWQILLIILAVVLILGFIFSLFWQYWLKKRLNREKIMASKRISIPLPSVRSELSQEGPRNSRRASFMRLSSGRRTASGSSSSSLRGKRRQSLR